MQVTDAPPAPAAPTPQAARLLCAAADRLTATDPDGPVNRVQLLARFTATAYTQQPRLPEPELHAAVREALHHAPPVRERITRGEYAALLRLTAQGVATR
jgi:hypothetical protein